MKAAIKYNEIFSYFQKYFNLNLPEDLVFSTRYYLRFKFFFWIVVPGTNCKQKNFENFFVSKKEDLVPG